MTQNEVIIFDDIIRIILYKEEITYLNSVG